MGFRHPFTITEDVNTSPTFIGIEVEEFLITAHRIGQQLLWVHHAHTAEGTHAHVYRICICYGTLEVTLHVVLETTLHVHTPSNFTLERPPRLRGSHYRGGLGEVGFLLPYDDIRFVVRVDFLGHSLHVYDLIREFSIMLLV